MSKTQATPGAAAEYYRMSRLTQEDSIERQQSQVRPFAEKNGYTIVRTYTDEGIGGDEIAKRKGFQQMLRDAQAGHFQAILCDDKDRFGRFDSIDLGEVVAPLRRKGVCLATVAQGVIDWNSFAGRISDAVLQEAKVVELEATSRRVLTDQLLRARKGIDTGGAAAFGYRWEPATGRCKRLVPDGRKAEVVRLAFEMYDRGASLYAVAEELYVRGVASPRGAPRWTRSVLQRLLSNRRYVGDWTWGVHPQGKRHRYAGGDLQAGRRKKGVPRRATQQDWIILPDAHEPLVDRALFERVQARLKNNRKATNPAPGGGDFVLSKLMVCGHCGASMTGVTDRGHRRYICRGYIAYGSSHCHRNGVPEREMVNALVGKLRQAYLDPDNLAALRKEVADQEERQRGDDNLGRLRQAVQSLDAKIQQGKERLLMLPPDRIPGVTAMLRQWEAERQQARRLLDRAEKASPARDLEQQIKAAEEMLWRLQEVLQASDAPLLRALFREMIGKVVLRWTHQRAGKVVRAHFAGAELYLRTTEEVSHLSPSAGR
jgi:DNA invertase Pin-like site-specific DNA recombinase